MADTLGDLIDKLTIANIRLWHLEDGRRDYCNRAEESSEEELRNLLNKVSQTNRERNSLIDQINASIRVLMDQAASRDSRFALTAEELLGTGKNKFYKGEDTP